MTDEVVAVRDAAVDEAGLVGEVLRRSFAPEWLASSVYSHPWGDLRIGEILAAPSTQRSSRIRVATVDASVVGCTLVDPIAGHLDYIAVLPEAAGAGVGGHLLADAEHAVPGPLSLDVFADNAAASSWYVRHGYVVTGERRSMTVLDVSGLAVGDGDGVEPPGETEVRTHGFAVARAELDKGSVDVVLYGEERLRIRAWDGLDLHEALMLVRSTWTTRPLVCLLGVDTRSEAPSIRWQGELVRMVGSPHGA